MQLGLQYSVLVNTYHVDYPDYSLNKYSFVNTKAPSLEVAAIEGGNRDFSASRGFTLNALVNIDVESCIFKWHC